MISKTGKKHFFYRLILAFFFVNYGIGFNGTSEKILSSRDLNSIYFKAKKQLKKSFNCISFPFRV